MSEDKKLTKVDQWAIKFKDKGLTYDQVAEKLTAKELTTITGKPINGAWVQSRINWLRETGKISPATPRAALDSSKSETFTPKRQYKKRSTMIEIPIATEEQRMAVVTGTPSQIMEFLRQWR